MPEILTAMRISIGFGWTTLVAAEMVAATHGLGQMVLNASNFLRTDIVIMGIVVIGAVAYLFDLLMRYVERSVVPWKGKVMSRARDPRATDETAATPADSRSSGRVDRRPALCHARRMTVRSHFQKLVEQRPQSAAVADGDRLSRATATRCRSRCPDSSPAISLRCWSVRKRASPTPPRRPVSICRASS